MTLDVKEAHLIEIKTILKTIIPDRKVVAFGSRVKNTAKKTSDLDLCIMGNTPLSFSILGNLHDAFSESNFPYKVDIVDWATTNPEFQKIIQADAVLVQTEI